MRQLASCLSAIFFILGVYLFTRPAEIGTNLPLFCTGFAIAFAGYIGLLSWGIVAGRKHWLINFWLLVLIARGLSLNMLPSDDLARYVWEGKILLEGHSPYTMPPDDPSLIEYRDARVYPMINHRDMPAIYPPFALEIFSALTTVTGSTEGFRLFMVFIELCTIALMFRWLAALGIPRERIAVYALNPLVILSIAGHGHLDSIQLLFLILGLLLYRQGREGLGILSVTLAGLTKFLCFFALPFLITRKTVRHLIPALVLVVVCYAPFFTFLGPFSLGNAGVYTGRFEFYSLTFAPLRTFLGTTGAQVLTIVVLGILAGGLWLTRTRPEQAIGPMFLAVTLMNTTVHFWYLVPVLALAPVWYSRSVLGLSLFMLPYFDVFRTLAATGKWIGLWWRQVLTYVPFIGLFWLEKSGRWPRTDRRRPTAGIVIPVLDDAKRLWILLSSLEETGIERDMVAVADGGSSDGSVDVAREWGARVVPCRGPGRGAQIAGGVQALSSEIVIILHCDTAAGPDLVDGIRKAAAAYPHAGGGACRLTYVGGEVSMKLLSLATNAKTAIFGLSFGDQAQWFRRSALAMPQIPLMEDVELALLMNDRGPAVWTPISVGASVRRYEERGRGTVLRQVIRRTLGYLARRRWHGDVPDTQGLFEEYYGTKPGPSP